jgi:nicotinamide mononucleotide (NMN) deamidase PncC
VVSEAAAFAAAVSAAEAGAAVAASLSAAEVAISATAGAGPSARIDRSSIGVIFTHDPNTTTKIRCVGRSGAPDFVFGG